MPIGFTSAEDSGAMYAFNFMDHCFQVSFRSGKNFWFKGDDIIFKWVDRYAENYHLYIKTAELKKKGII